MIAVSNVLPLPNPPLVKGREQPVNYSDFQSYKVHPSPLIACGKGVGGGVLVPGLMTICCNVNQICTDTGNMVWLFDSKGRGKARALLVST